jgi:hypothetical protein
MATESIDPEPFKTWVMLSPIRREVPAGLVHNEIANFVSDRKVWQELASKRAVYVRVHLLGFYNPSKKIAFLFVGSAEDWELIESDMTHAFSGGRPTLVLYPRSDDIVCKIDHLQIFRISLNWSCNLNDYGENAAL